MPVTNEELYNTYLAEYLRYQVYESLDFSMLYYENAGEMVGAYRYDPITILNADGFTAEKAEDYGSHADVENLALNRFPGFFEQGGARVRPVIRNGPEQNNFLNQQVMWATGMDVTPYLPIRHYLRSIGTSVILNQRNQELSEDVEIHFGEFHLLSNNHKSLKRFNLKSELLQEQLNETAFLYKKAGYKYPDHTAKGMSDQFVRWYFGYSQVPTDQRPPFLDLPNIKPDACNMVHGENRRRWRSVREECVTWTRVHDKTNINLDHWETVTRPGNYVCMFKAVIDIYKFRKFLQESFASENYESSTVNYDLILYPPTMYMYPADSAGQ